MLSAKPSALALVVFGLGLALTPLAAGCAADGADDATSEDALTEYDAVAKGKTKVESSTTPTATESAHTRIVGFIKGRDADAVAGQLLKVARWKEVEADDGSKPFTAARVVSDSTANGTRTLAAHLTLDGGIDLDVRATSKNDNGAIVVGFTNTSEYTHWLAGKVLEKGKLKIDVKVVPHEGGTIVDATARVKLAAAEDRAAGLTGALLPIFTWLKSTTPAP
jgi:hypothetical protein